MFEIESFVRFLSLLTYLGFISSSISGFYEISINFNLCEMFVSLIVLCISVGLLYIQISKKMFIITNSIKNEFYINGTFMIVCALLILGLSDVGIGFGIWGILMSVISVMYGIFLTDDYEMNESVNVRDPESNIEP
jgi:hypothetical protein